MSKACLTGPCLLALPKCYLIIVLKLILATTAAHATSASAASSNDITFSYNSIYNRAVSTELKQAISKELPKEAKFFDELDCKYLESWHLVTQVSNINLWPANSSCLSHPVPSVCPLLFVIIYVQVAQERKYFCRRRICMIRLITCKTNWIGHRDYLMLGSKEFMQLFLNWVTKAYISIASLLMIVL